MPPYSRPASPRILLMRLGLVLLVLFGLTGFRTLDARFAPKSDLWDRWTVHAATSPGELDFSDWDTILKTYIATDAEGLNRFNYGAVTPADRARLKSFIAAQTTVAISAYNRAAQEAFWINLYNALTVDVVLDAYPVASIKDINISPGLFAKGPWDKDLVTIEGEAVSLNDIEHRILRPIWQDARIHYAVNCAAIGCPNLQRDAFTIENTELLLEQAARDYINSPRGVSITGERVQISSIYNWFFDDFGSTEDDVMNHILRYADPALAGRLRKIGALHDAAYDWRLNDPR